MASFISDPSRDASDVIAGFVFQVNLTIQRWLELKDDEVLELERGEDLDTVQLETGQLPEARTLEQIKRRGSPLSLKSSDALASVARFCEHRKTNPRIRLRFRFITTGRLAKERTWTRPDTAISAWQSIYREQLTDAEQERALEAIRQFLQGCRAPAGLSQGTWPFVKDIAKRDNRAELLDVIQSFEWSLGVIDHSGVEDAVKRALIRTGFAKDEGTSYALFERLFLYVFKRLTQHGLKRLTTAELRAQLGLSQLSENDEAFLVFIQDLRGLARRVENLEGRTARHDQLLTVLGDRALTLEVRRLKDTKLSAPNAAIDRPAPVQPGLPRLKIIDEILSHLSRKTWVSVIGEPGAGKTQLCLLAADRARSETLWINLRECSPEQACNVVDAVLEVASGVPFHVFLPQWYEEATSHFVRGKLLILDDLPRVVNGGALWRRLDALCAACEIHALRMLSTTYFELPRLLVESRSIAEFRSPRFSRDEIAGLVKEHSAPDALANEKFIDFLLLLTEGLPILVAAGIRFLKTRNWKVDEGALKSFFTGEFARGIKQDARVMIESTITDDRARELLYRLTCVVGPISRKQVENICRVPKEIRLGFEKLDQLVGLWVQPYTEDTRRLSPLVETSLSSRLDSRTRRGVHAVLGMLLMKQKTYTPMDIATCVHHFQQAELLREAAIVLVKALMTLTEIDQEIPDESLLTAVWTDGPLPDAIDLNVRLHLRALQIGFADKRGDNFSFLLGDLDKLMAEAEKRADFQFGVYAAGGSIAIRFARKYPAIANRYILAMLRSAPRAILPNGAKIAIPSTMSIEWLLWMTANSTTTDEDVASWLATLRQLTREQLATLSSSEFAADSSVVICDQMWLREYRKPESQQDWPSSDAVVQQIENTAAELGLGLLQAAAVRTRLTILAESQHRLDAAIILAEERLSSASSDVERFLITEVIGRQLAYARRWDEALEWMSRALQMGVAEYGIFRRNLFITAGEGVALSDPLSAPDYTRQAIEVAKSSGLELIRVAEALAEHALALWNARRMEDSFLAWQEGVEALFKARDQRPSWTQAFLAFLHASGYFSGLSLLDKLPSSNYAIPKPGMFLALDNMPVEKYQPIQDGLLLLRTAMFAEGVADTAASAKWGILAFTEARRQSGAELLHALSWLPIPNAVLSGDYAGVVQQAYAMSQLATPDETSLDSLEIEPADKGRFKHFYADKNWLERAQLFGLVPLAFRLATLRFDREIATELDVVASSLSQLPSEASDDWKHAADIIQLIFSGQNTWEELHRHIERHYANKKWSFGILASLGALLAAPLRQSLGSQVSLFRDLEKMFRISPSIRTKLLAPFFVRFWEEAIKSSPNEFRTSAAYTQKAYLEVMSMPPAVRVKKLLALMVFCTGLSLRADLQAWLDTDS